MLDRDTLFCLSKASVLLLAQSSLSNLAAFTAPGREERLGDVQSCARVWRRRAAIIYSHPRYGSTLLPLASRAVQADRGACVFVCVFTFVFVYVCVCLCVCVCVANRCAEFSRAPTAQRCSHMRRILACDELNDARHGLDFNNKIVLASRLPRDDDDVHEITSETPDFLSDRGDDDTK